MPEETIPSMLRRNIWGIATLVLVAIVCATVVHVFKKPGQMSVLESQAMDMSVMVPPKGAVPVAMAPAIREPICGAVTYTGTVQAFTDEDIYPRVTGRVVKMPVYPGDVMKAGQLLVQLDPSGDSEYSAKLQEAQSAEEAARHNAGIAKSEFTQKKFELEAAKNNERAAEKALSEASANLDYWRPEIERQGALLKAQVVSLDEYQKELAQQKVAEAQVEQAQAKLLAATSSRFAAQADLDTMIHHVGHQYSAAEAAKAALKNTAIYEKYTRIVSQADGVVIKRLISPGVVVSPGMMLLKVSHIKQIRIQAEVASADADRLSLGNEVLIKGSPGSKEEIKAKITSIFPAADPASRTFTVEALLDNVRDRTGAREKQVDSLKIYRFLPGQYVVMKISTGQHEGLTIPTSAVVWREGKAQVWKATASTGMGKKQYTCTMHPEVVTDSPGKCPKCGMNLVPKELSGKSKVELVSVELGLSNPDRTEVTNGIAEGDQVVFAGSANLQPGTAVVATDWGQAGPLKLPTAAEVHGNRLDSGNNWTHEQMEAGWMWKISLDPPKGGNNFIVVKVEKHGAGVVSGVKVAIKTSMPGMGDMAGPELRGTTDGSGKAMLKSDLSSGLWRLQVRITPPGAAPIDSTADVEVP